MISRLTCSSWVVPWTITSSKMLCAPSHPWINCWIHFWYISGAQLIPIIKCLYRKRPLWVANVMISLELWWSSVWWQPYLRSRLLNMRLWLKSLITSSIVGMGNLFRLTAKLSLLISTHSRISFPFAFGTQPTGDTQSHGPSTRPIMTKFPVPVGFYLTYPATGMEYVERFEQLVKPYHLGVSLIESSLTSQTMYHLGIPVHNMSFINRVHSWVQFQNVQP